MIALKMENYIGKYYKNVEKTLTEKGFNVVIEKKGIYSKNGYMLITEQNPAAGATINSGDTITLTIPKKIAYMPDFKNGKYTAEDVEAFCKDIEVSCVTSNDFTTDVPLGTVVNQFPDPGTKIEDTTMIIINIRTKNSTLEQ